MAEKERVGFIGVGLMGHGMAKNIVEKGWPLSVMGHRNRAPVEDLVGRGAVEAASPREMAARSDVIFLCVTSSTQVEDLVRRPDGITAGAHAGLTVVDCSTSLPESTLALAVELAEKGATLIDAPLGRTPREAEEGRLNAFVGSDDATLARLRPLLESWAENIIHVGPVGNGHKIKLINNFVAMSYAAIFAEAYTMCAKAGVASTDFHDVISAGGLNSGFYQNVSKWVIGGDEKAHEFTIANCKKDITYYTRLADSVGATAPVGSAVAQVYALALQTGAGDRYMPMLVDVMAGLNNVTVR